MKYLHEENISTWEAIGISKEKQREFFKLVKQISEELEDTNAFMKSKVIETILKRVSTEDPDELIKVGILLGSSLLSRAPQVMAIVEQSSKKGLLDRILSSPPVAEA